MTSRPVIDDLSSFWMPFTSNRQFKAAPRLIVGAKGETAGFRQACIAGAKTIPAYLAFLAVCYFAIGRVDYRLALLGGLAAWFIVALAVFLAPRWT